MWVHFDSIPYTWLLLNAILMGCSAALFFKAAELEHKSPWLWTALSLFIYFVTAVVLGFGWLGCILGQVALWTTITLIRAALALRNK